MRRILIFLITGYQKTLSPDHGWLRVFFPGGFCRYFPSCSEYMRQVSKQNGVRGLGQGFFRILRCNPFSRGGFDPPRVSTFYPQTINFMRDQNPLTQFLGMVKWALPASKKTRSVFPNEQDLANPSRSHKMRHGSALGKLGKSSE